MLRILTGEYDVMMTHEVDCKEGVTLREWFDWLDNSDVIELPPGVIVDRPGCHLPESHQYEIGLNLCHIRRDVCVFTHSSHLLNGVRVGLKKSLISPGLVQVVFYKDEGQIHHLVFDANGRCPNWPDGFMDTIDKALEELLDT